MKLVFVLLTLAGGACAQLRDNRTPQMGCEGRNYDRERERFCEIREQTIAGVGRLTVDPGKNGGVTVKGWLRNDVSIRTRVETWASSAGEAGALAGLVSVDASAGQVKASGPGSQRDSGWSVSYEIFVPQSTDLSMTSFNGGINLSDVRGRIEFKASNGGVRLTRVAGDVTGKTLNGGIQVELTGRTWEGGKLEASTTNGGVTLAMPENYSAHIQTETVNGAIDTDFPVSVTVQGRIRPQNLDFNVGSGGPLIHVSTTNGGVKLRKI
ncbi:MAG: hypothetical protein LAO55_24630 [Acidobacteriia bacterium]|nr:hypothetical protein [Terriglobia bacterium]